MKRIYLWDTILTKIKNATNCGTFDVDIRYLNRWLKECPECFPKFMLKSKYNAVFNWELMRWEITK